MRLGRMAIAVVAVWLAAPAPASWFEARTPHFIVYAEGDALAGRTLAMRLERLDKGMRLLLKLPDPGSGRANPLTVFAVDGIDQVNQLCRGVKGSEASCRNVAGFYQGRAAGSVAFVPRASGDGSAIDQQAHLILFHEYAHHLMLGASDTTYPDWYVEGFAEFIATTGFERPGQLSIGLPPAHRYLGLAAGKPLSLAALLSSRPADLNEAEREALYGRGWLLTHYLMLGNGREGQLARYIAAINAGASSLNAARQAFGDLVALDRELDAYLGRKRIAFFFLPVPDLPPDIVVIRTLPAGESAMMPVRLRSQRAVDKAVAPALAAEARRTASAFATDPGAQLVLAEAEFDADNFEAAEAAADRALAVSPHNRLAMTFKAQAMMGRAKRSGKLDRATWQATRDWVLRARRAEPDAAWPLILYYLSFLGQQAPPPADAIAGLERGCALVPQDNAVRMLLVGQYLRDMRLADARAALAPLAFNPHLPADNPARKLIAMIEARERAGEVGIPLPTIDPNTAPSEPSVPPKAQP